ncbi:MAG: TlpA family protein disulfide reductase [Betaproteobacteria bacterium]|nr:TlpA family protein disulfide reductase [Betaproteobacteria bacterium]
MNNNSTTPRAKPWARPLAIAAIALLALGLGMVAGHLANLRPPASPEASPEAAARLQALVLNSPDGQAIALSQWQDKVRVLNFWATWCPPCRQEIPALARIQEQFAANGVQLLGIALDSQDSVREFASQSHIPYPLLLASPEAIETLTALGNHQGALPFTVILDRQGQIRYAGAGSLDEERITHLLAPLIAR